jgi:hypothetical protein
MPPGRGGVCRLGPQTLRSRMKACVALGQLCQPVGGARGPVCRSAAGGSVAGCVQHDRARSLVCRRGPQRQFKDQRRSALARHRSGHTGGVYGLQALSVESAVGACALIPRPKGRGTSRFSVVRSEPLGPGRSQPSGRASPAAQHRQRHSGGPALAGRSSDPSLQGLHASHRCKSDDELPERLATTPTRGHFAWRPSVLARVEQSRIRDCR